MVHPSCCAPRPEKPATASAGAAGDLAGPGSEAAFLIGDPCRELTRESEICDLLVVGSRSHGPEGAVVLGGVSDRVMRTAACPALIVPNGVKTPMAELFPACGKLLIDSTDAPGSRAHRLPVAS